VQGLRRSLPLMASLVLLFGLGALGLALVSDSRKAAEAAYRQSNLEREHVVASLVQGYVMLAVSELDQWGRGADLSLTPGHPGDGAALRSFIDNSGFFNQGAVLTDMAGRTLSAYSRAPGLPPAADPGFQPLREALLRGRPGVSSIMTVDGVPVIALAVAVRGPDRRPAAIVTGFFRSATSPLQAYSEGLRERSHADAYVVDASGIVLSSRQQVSDIGRPAPVSPAVAAMADGPGVVHFDRDGVEMVTAFAPVGVGGWGLIEELDADRYYGDLRTKSDATTVAIIVLLVAGALVALLLHQRAERVRLRGQRRAEALIRDAGDIITVLDRNAVVTYTSPAALRVLGMAPDDAVGHSAFSWVHPDEADRMRAVFAELLSAPGVQRRAQARILRSDGAYIPCDMSLTNALDDPDVRGVVLNLRDIAELMTVHEELQRQALHDPLTDLANRALLEDRIAERLDQPMISGRVAAALFIDLDGFKRVNDSRGHDVGDALLVEVAARLRRCVRDCDTVARLGGDEFVIFLDGVDSATGASEVATRVLSELNQPFRGAGPEVPVSGSIGVALAEQGQSAESLLREADVAMYLAKERGKARFELSAA
jgi:diguanylate cyclase (GGDEF)-like protein/PAS domain S-box-containing protein